MHKNQHRNTRNRTKKAVWFPNNKYKSTLMFMQKWEINEKQWQGYSNHRHAV